MKEAKSLTQRLAIASALAAEVASDVDEVARKASEFSGAAVIEPNVPAPLLPPSRGQGQVQRPTGN